MGRRLCVRPELLTFTSRRNCGRALAAARTLAPASAWRNMTRGKPSEHLRARSLGEKLDSLRRGTRHAQLFFRLHVEAGVVSWRLRAATFGRSLLNDAMTSGCASLTSNKPSQSARIDDNVTLRGGTSDWVVRNRALVRTLAPRPRRLSFVDRSLPSSDLPRVLTLMLE